MWTAINLLSIIIHCVVCLNISPIAAPKTHIGFDPIWDDCTQSLYYVDLGATGQELSIFRYDDEEERVYGAYIEGSPLPPSFILPVKDCNKHKNLFAVGISHYTRIIEWNGRSSVAKLTAATAFGVEEFDSASRWVSAKPNQHGQFFGGTGFLSFCKASSANLSLYSYSNKGVQRLFGGLLATTGLAFDNEHLYHVDACQLLITAFDQDSKGDICNGRIVFDFKKLGYNLPNFATVGLDIDTDGNLYTTNFAGDTVWKIDPRTSSAVPIAILPYKGLGGIAFGGSKKDNLFVVTCSDSIDVLTATLIGNTDVGTSLYKITDLNAQGHNNSRLIL